MVEMEKVFEFEEPVRVDLMDGVLYINYHKIEGTRKIGNVSSILVNTEDGYPIGIIRKSGALYHVIRLKIRPEGYAVAEVKTRR